MVPRTDLQVNRYYRSGDTIFKILKINFFPDAHFPRISAFCYYSDKRIYVSDLSIKLFKPFILIEDSELFEELFE